MSPSQLLMPGRRRHLLRLVISFAPHVEADGLAGARAAFSSRLDTPSVASCSTQGGRRKETCFSNDTAAATIIARMVNTAIHVHIALLCMSLSGRCASGSCAVPPRETQSCRNLCAV
jgi:hypothetical protein